MQNLNFTIDYPTQVSLVACIIFPIVLFFIARIRRLSGHNASQFFISFIVTTIVFLLFLGISIYNTISTSNEVDFTAIWTSFFIYSSAMLIYLEIWALLSRGYTLGLLLTFYKSKKPLDMNELASLYRGGEGLAWLIKHRFSGLISAKLIKLKNEENQVTLTYRGILIAFLYKQFKSFFGLKATG